MNTPRLLVRLAAACALAPLAGAAQPDAPAITIDGVCDEWPADTPIVADADEIHITFENHDPAQTIQSADFTTRIRIDADADATTGHRLGRDALKGNDALGAELIIELSPPRESGDDSGDDPIGSGTRVRAFDAEARATDIGHADAGFFFLPTHSAPRYEMRLSRHATHVHALRDPGPIRVAIEAVDGRGRVLKRTVHAHDLPMCAHDEHDATIPPRPDGALRVMAANVLFSSPLDTPDPFRRILAATDPDVVLYQEWFDTPRRDIQAWLDTHAARGWRLIGGADAGGLAIATRRPILETWALGAEQGWGRGGLAALIDHDGTPVLAVSVHLKCCGGADSPEERRRLEQAAGINRLIRGILDQHPEARVVIGGDYNLVGTRAPLERLARGLSANGDLTPAHTLRLADGHAVTWTNPQSSFSPGRLDWMLYDDASWSAPHAFTLDTRLLAPRARRDAGLRAGDSAASDHLPLVVDLAPRD